MKKFSIFLVTYSVVCFLLVALLPFSVSYENQMGTDMYLFVYFNGRIKIVSITEGTEEILRWSAGIWEGAYPQKVWVMIVLGLGAILVATLYKILMFEKEDRRISSILTLIGGILGLTGTLLFLTFMNSTLTGFLISKTIYGFYTSIGIFSSFILIGIIMLVFALKNPFSPKEFDPIEEAMYK